MQLFIRYHWKEVYLSFLLPIFGIVLLSQHLCAQEVLWVKPVATGETAPTSTEYVGTDAQEHIYVSGKFTGTLFFGTTPLVGNPDTTTRTYLAKFTKEGEFLWVQQLDYMQNVPAQIAVDSTGNVYVAGQFVDSLYFEDTTLVASGNYAYIAKYNRDGSRAWIRLLEDAIMRCVAVDRYGNVCIGTYYSPNSTLKTKASVLMYTTLGDLLWRKEIATDLSCLIDGLAIGASGNIVLAGSFTGDSVAIGDTVLYRVVQERKMLFVFSLLANGALRWAAQADYDYRDAGRVIESVAMDGEDNVIVVGGYAGTLHFDSDSIVGADNFSRSSIFLLKYKPDGDVQWIRSIGIRGKNRALCVVVNDAGSLYVAGRFFDTLTIGSDFLRGRNFQEDHFFARFNQDGQAVWAKAFINIRLGKFNSGTTSYSNQFLCGRTFGELQIGDSVIPINQHLPVLIKVGTATTDVADASYVLPAALTLYPHPVTDGELNIELPVFVGKAELVVSDILGRRVYSQTVQGVAEGTPVRIVLPDVPEGVYVLTVRTATSVVANKSFVVGR